VFNRYRKSINGTLGVLETGQPIPGPTAATPASMRTRRTLFQRPCALSPTSTTSTSSGSIALTITLSPEPAPRLIEVDENKRPKCTQISWEEHFHDPRARRKDLADARYQGIAKWMYADTLQGMYPDKKQEIENALDVGGRVYR
jgi:hypothetical protein